MSVRDFRPIKPSLTGGVPILGGPGSAPAQVRDALGRVLAEGDLIILKTTQEQVYKVTKIQPLSMPSPNGPVPLMDIQLASAARFSAQRDQPNAEFVRVMSAGEVAAQMAPPGTPAEEPPDPPQTLKDA